MKVIAVNGASHSGKTTVCEVIIRELRRRGRTVGSVKEIHCQGFTLDPDPRTDTGLHRSAGVPADYRPGLEGNGPPPPNQAFRGGNSGVLSP